MRTCVKLRYYIVFPLNAFESDSHNQALSRHFYQTYLCCGLFFGFFASKHWIFHNEIKTYLKCSFISCHGCSNSNYVALQNLMTFGLPLFHFCVHLIPVHLPNTIIAPLEMSYEVSRKTSSTSCIHIVNVSGFYSTLILSPGNIALRDL